MFGQKPERYDKRYGPAALFSEKERRYKVDMMLGSRVLLKSILATGKTHTQLTPQQAHDARKAAGL